MLLLKRNYLKFSIILAIGILSLAIIFLRMPQTANFIAGNRIDASSYGITVYNPSGNTLFYISPLNDYFYQDKAREHIQYKILSSNDGNFIQKISTSIKDSIFNTKSLIWNTNGINSKGNANQNIIIKSSANKIEITREIRFNEAKMGAIGQVINICSDCLVVDDKNRTYFNGDLVTAQKLNNAYNLHLIPVLVGEGQAFSQDSAKISVLSAAGKMQMELVMPKNGQMFLQDKWHLIELKVPVPFSRNSKVIQEIFIPK